MTEIWSFKTRVWTTNRAFMLMSVHPYILCVYVHTHTHMCRHYMWSSLCIRGQGRWSGCDWRVGVSLPGSRAAGGTVYSLLCAPGMSRVEGGPEWWSARVCVCMCECARAAAVAVLMGLSVRVKPPSVGSVQHTAAFVPMIRSHDAPVEGWSSDPVRTSSSSATAQPTWPVPVWI